MNNLATTSDTGVIKAVIFDKDGTLFEFEKTWMAYCDLMFDQLVGQDIKNRQLLAEACGFDIQSRQFLPGSLIVGGSIDELCKTWSSLLPEWNVSEVASLSEVIIDRLSPDPVCDLQTMVQTLREDGIVLGLITNDLESAAISQLKNVAIEKDFALILGSDSGFSPKPAPDAILSFCQQTNISPSAVAMVGDSMHDLQASKASDLGLTVAVLTGPAKADTLASHADTVLENVEQLPQLLKTINQAIAQ